MPPEMQVNPAALRLLAAAMTAYPWMTPSVQPVPPDALPLAQEAVRNLNENARVLAEYQKWAEAENQRLAESFTNAAAAYEEVDRQYKDRLDDPGRQVALDAIKLPEPTVQLPPLPQPAATPSAPDGGGYSEVPKTHQDLTGPDQGASLDTARAEWEKAATFVETRSQFEFPTDWQGDAAEAAFTRLNTFSEWLNQLSGAWKRLAGEAAKVKASHQKALFEHVPIYTRYLALEDSIGVGNSVDVDAIVAQMKELQRQSDEVREEYARNATTDNVQIEDPPGANRGAAQPGGGAGGGGAGGAAQPGGGGGGGGQGDQLTGDPAAMADRMAQSLGQPRTPAKPSAGGGSPSGGGAPSGGGSPSGGGAPGGAPGGMPGGGPSSGTPKLPTDPSLRPAAASGGGGAGGMPNTPLSPAVTAETVAPGPPTPRASAAPAAAPGGAAGGAMGGGMAPMHGMGGAQQGKEKRRNPNLAPDEDLYKEDRPWTEAVIGNRRRKEVDDKDAK